MKKYGVLGRVWGNIVTTLGLSLAILILREIKHKSFSLENRFGVLLKDFGNILLAAGILVTALQLMYWYYCVEVQKISFGCTRKKSFLDMQKVKLLSTAAIIGINILFNLQQLSLKYWETLIWIAGIFLIAQSLGEVTAVFQTRHTWLSTIVLTITSAILGFAVGYGVLYVINGNKGETSFSLQSFVQAPFFYGSIFIVGILCMIGISWRLWRKAEVHI